MNIQIISLNSKYAHTALSVWYLKANCHAENCKVKEFTINEPLSSIYCSILSDKPDVLAFSCYIWNIEQILKLSETLKKAMPDVKIILGGPEVSYHGKEMMAQYPFIDYIIMGEGEQAFDALISGDENAPGIVRRRGEEIIVNDGYQMISVLDCIKSPYTQEMIQAAKDKILYFEASRGCPFSCSYCLSSTFDGVRYFSLDRVKAELKKLQNAGIQQIKFVDRTFNCNKKRAAEIIDFIINETGKVHFHFEIAADLLDDQLISLLAKAPLGKIQLEIGVQTVNEKALDAVQRKTDTAKVLDNVKKLQKAGNIHLHLDLIAGLPYENYESFQKSFNEIYHVNPHQLQLGFLKLLKGSKIREENKHGYVYASYPPYEIISNEYISAEGLLQLKKIEDVLDRFYNSGRFTKTLEYLVEEPFAFYKELSERIHFMQPPSAAMLYEAFFEFVSEHKNKPLLADLMKLDFLSSTRFGKMPSCFCRKTDSAFKDKCFAYLKSIPSEIPAKERMKNLHFEIFEYDLTKQPYEKKETVLLFDYQNYNHVTGKYYYEKITL